MQAEQLEALSYLKNRIVQVTDSWRLGAGCEGLSDSSPNSLNDRGVLAVTFGRLALVPFLCEGIANQDLMFTSVVSGAVVGTDIWDGWYARRLGQDTDRRRIADAVVDRITIGAAFLVASRTNPDIIPYCAPLVVNGLATSSIGLWSYFKRNTLLLSSKAHRAGSLSGAAFGLAAVSGSTAAMIATASVATVANTFLTSNYLGAGLEVAGHEASTNIVRKKIKGLRGTGLLFRRLLNNNEVMSVFE